MVDSVLTDMAVVLRDSQYWNIETFSRFKEACRVVGFESPSAFLDLCRHGPDLAAKIAPTTERPELIYLDAYALLGNAYQLNAAPDEAERVFAEAQRYAEGLTALETADLKMRMAYLRRDQRRFAEAFALINEAIQSYRLEGDLTQRSFLGHCYLARGSIHYEQGDPNLAAVDLATALVHIDPKQRPRIHYAAVHNLAVGNSDGAGRTFGQVIIVSDHDDRFTLIDQ